MTREVRVVGVTEKNFDQIPRPARRGFNCQECFFWMGKKDGKLDLVKHKQNWLTKKASFYDGPLAKMALWGKRRKPVGFIQFGPIPEFQTAMMRYGKHLSVPRGGWCITCLSVQGPYQDKGVAGRMARNVLRDLKRRGVKVVDTYELADFWQNFNFEAVWEDKKKKMRVLRKEL
jgi:ribosomal protein S18 acetylase RimI-like enzyme